jgi:eukaryotic-like serine/threonine-protein kinase
MSVEHERLKEILAHAAYKSTPAERAAYLDVACGGDAELRRQVDTLLSAHQRAGDFLEAPALPSMEESRLNEGPGAVIGRYKLLQQIGEGGCGVVYMAEQEQPMHRRVAFKIIKAGMDTKAVIARFEAERQALALMDHPNIAKVYDAGATETGRPYFVMELVRGTKITEYCDENRLSTAQRLALFVQVCHALQHAHQKGIIHRDIKPSNILVTLHDGAPMPKVIDFGIAKATGQRLTDKTLFTAFEQFIGTPAYVSPEQAQLSAQDVDTRSDIYALGVLLYELLTGHTPFDQQELFASGLDEMRRIIREEEPARPSTRLSTLAVEEQTTVAKRRHAEPPELIHRVRGDLDWIVMKCLEKDRARRYETANALAEDVSRHINNEAVAARPPSRLYRLEKLVRRNKLVFASGTAMVAALLLGLGFSLWSLAKEQRARLRAITAERTQSRLREQAQAQARKSDQIARFLQDMLRGVGPSVALGRDSTMLREILDQTAERVGKDLQGQPEVEAELRSTIGAVYEALGLYQKAEAMHRLALTLRQGLWGNLNTNVADSLDSLGWELLQQDKVDAAEPSFQEALAIRTNLLGPENVKVATSLYHLGIVRNAQAPNPQAEALLRQSLDMRRKLLGNENLEVVESLNGLSTALFCAGRPDQAEAAAREALAIQARVLPDERSAPDAGTTQLHLGRALIDQNKFSEAEPVVRQAVALRRNLLGTEHHNVAQALAVLAQVLIGEDKLVEAEAVAREGIAISRRTIGEQHFTTAECLIYLGVTLHKARRLMEAETALREALGIWHQLANLRESGAIWNGAWTWVMLATVLEEQGKQSERQALSREEVDTARKSLDPGSQAGAFASVGNWFRSRGQPAEAEAAYREGLDICVKVSPDNFESRQWLASGLASVLKNQGKLVQAEAAYREAVTNATKVWPEDPARWEWDVTELALLLQSQGQVVDVEKLAAEVLSPKVPTRSARLVTLRALVELSGGQGQWQDAAAILREFLELNPSDPYAHLELAAVQAQTGDFEGYRAHCREMLNRFGRVDNTNTLAMASKACLLVPGACPDLERACEMAQRALEMGMRSNWRSYYQMANGLAQYRQGDYVRAVESMRAVIGLQMSVGSPLQPYVRDVAAGAVLAMAQCRLGQGEQARAALASATLLAQTKLPQLGSRNLGGTWRDWLVAQVLLREAKAMVERGGEGYGPTATDAPAPAH